MSTFLGNFLTLLNCHPVLDICADGVRETAVGGHSPRGFHDGFRDGERGSEAMDQLPDPDGDRHPLDARHRGVV